MTVGVFARIYARARRDLGGRMAKLLALSRPTYVASSGSRVKVLPMYPEMAPDRDVVNLNRNFLDLVFKQADHGLSHRFDLLGSGPVTVHHGMSCLGVEGRRYGPHATVRPDADGRWLEGRLNRSNLAEGVRIWRHVDPGYRPIDWQLDFKSGYRWREGCWHRDIRFSGFPGVDVKVPWELARLQHLPTLALAYRHAVAHQKGNPTPDRYARELRNQILDFIACNPPGFGVNWACAMDVAIRAVNLLLARDLANASGWVFDQAFEEIFAASMTAHARHIVANLEWSPRYRGNHYLANIAGLAFIAASLPGDEEVDAWLAFAVQELVSEIGYQFHDDGSNFEASVCYHRLSAEIVLWTSALIAGLSPEKRAVLKRPRRHRSLPRLRADPLPFHRLPWGGGDSPLPDWCWQRLSRMADFTRAMTRPDGLVVQFGDNDSGRFVTVCSAEQQRVGNDPGASGWSLDHGELVAGIDALLRNTPNRDPGVNLLLLLARKGADAIAELPGIPVPSGSDRVGALQDERIWSSGCVRRDTAKSRRTSRFAVPSGSGNSFAPPRLESFHGMGCYVVRGRNFYLAIRCGEIGLAGLGAHAHCDQLGIELVVEGEDIVRDPGTYLYTCVPERRNAYRAARAHHVPRVAGREPANLDRHLFDLRDMAPGECLYFGAHGFLGRHAGYGPYVYRQITLENDAIVIDDFADAELELSDPSPEPLPFSPGYGRLHRREA